MCPWHLWAIQRLWKDTMEGKRRMFTLPVYSRNGIASQLLAELKAWAVGACAKRVVLETGKKASGAISLYERNAIDEFQLCSKYIA